MLQIHGYVYSGMLQIAREYGSYTRDGVFLFFTAFGHICFD